MVNTTLLEADRSAIPPLADSDQKLFRRLSVLFPERLDGIEGGRCLPLKVETHALFRYAPRRQDPSFSFPEVIRKGMEDGPLRACLRLPGEDGSGRQKVGQYRMIPPPLKSFCRSVSTRADGSGT